LAYDTGDDVMIRAPMTYDMGYHHHHLFWLICNIIYHGWWYCISCATPTPGYGPHARIYYKCRW